MFSVCAALDSRYNLYRRLANTLAQLFAQIWCLADVWNYRLRRPLYLIHSLTSRPTHTLTELRTVIRCLPPCTAVGIISLPSLG